MRRAWEIVHWFSERLLPRRRPIKFEEIYEHLDSPSTRSHGRDNMLIGPLEDNYLKIKEIFGAAKNSSHPVSVLSFRIKDKMCLRKKQFKGF